MAPRPGAGHPAAPLMVKSHEPLLTLRVETLTLTFPSLARSRPNGRRSSRSSSSPRPPCSPAHENTSRRTFTIDSVHPEHQIERSFPVHSQSSSSSPCTSSASVVDCLVSGSSPTTSSSPPTPLPRDDADAPAIDYVTDDPSFLSEQPDVGAQEPDATADAYYYV
ncbi:hypothetical protein ACQJBY_019299 [Aegilops geniculata]